jgi:xylan 1,4-beta-xylosidase
VQTTSTGQLPLDTILAAGIRQAPDVDALATKAAHEAAVLVWNYSDLQAADAEAPTTITVHGLPPTVHRVLLQHDRLDQTHGNAYTLWQSMGSPQKPTPEQYAALQSAGQLQRLTSPQWLEVKNETVVVTTVLPPQSVSLLHLSW